MKSFPYFTGDETPDRFLYNEAGPQRGGEGGPLKVEDIEDLNDVDRSEAELAEVQAALTKANSILDGEPHDLTIKALKKIDADGRFTMADVAELDTFAPRIKAKLEEIRAKRVKEQGIDATGSGGMDLGLGLTEVEEAPSDDLGLGLAATSEADDLGLGLASTDTVLTDADLSKMEKNARYLAPDGDFGVFNQIDPEASNKLFSALLGDGKANIAASLDRAGAFINSGGAEAPSYQSLYQAMYPKDATNDYARLRGIIGEDAFAQLNFPNSGRLDKAA